MSDDPKRVPSAFEHGLRLMLGLPVPDILPQIPDVVIGCVSFTQIELLRGNPDLPPYVPYKDSIVVRCPLCNDNISRVSDDYFP